MNIRRKKTNLPHGQDGIPFRADEFCYNLDVSFDGNEYSLSFDEFKYDAGYYTGVFSVKKNNETVIFIEDEVFDKYRNAKYEDIPFDSFDVDPFNDTDEDDYPTNEDFIYDLIEDVDYSLFDKNHSDISEEDACKALGVDMKTLKMLIANAERNTELAAGFDAFDTILIKQEEYRKQR